MNYFSITSFAEDFLRSTLRIGAHNCCTTFAAGSVMEFMRISMAHAIFVPLVWMTSWDREMVLDIKYELLFDNLKWFFGYLTLDNASQERIDIFLS